MTEEVSMIDINRINEVKEHTEPFVTLSDVAMEEIRKVISAQDKKDLFLRLYVQSAVGGMSFGMALDTRKSEDDHSCFVESVEVRIDRISFPYLTGANVDYLRSTEKTGFQINSPNTELIAAAAGGCTSCSGDAGCC
jgi:iron-sulfur cluster assembly accessory protein